MGAKCVLFEAGIEFQCIIRMASVLKYVDSVQGSLAYDVASIAARTLISIPESNYFNIAVREGNALEFDFITC